MQTDLNCITMTQLTLPHYLGFDLTHHQPLLQLRHQHLPHRFSTTDPHENIPEQPNIATQPDLATPDQNPKQQPKPNVKVKPKPQGTVPNPDEFFEIEKLLKQKRINGKKHFLVKWKDGSANTWEPEDNVSKPAIKHFYSTHTRKGKPRKRKGFKFFKKSNEAEQQ